MNIRNEEEGVKRKKEQVKQKQKKGQKESLCLSGCGNGNGNGDQKDWKWSEGKRVDKETSVSWKDGGVLSHAHMFPLWGLPHVIPSPFLYHFPFPFFTSNPPIFFSFFINPSPFLYFSFLFLIAITMFQSFFFFYSTTTLHPIYYYCFYSLLKINRIK